MALTMTITFTEGKEGMGYEIHSEGSCSEREADSAQYIYRAVVVALEAKGGVSQGDVVNQRINTYKGNVNVH